MPILKNQRHEAVAQAYVLDPHKVGWKAYKFVYQKASEHAAECGFTRLYKDVVFCERIAELHAEAAQNAEITLESLLREAEETRQLALKLEHTSAAVSALKLKSELSGHYVQRKESTIKHSETDWSLDDLVTFINDSREGMRPDRKTNGGGAKPDIVH
jgi:hypothetical protein